MSNEAKVLVIDDDPYIVEVVSTALSLLGDFKIYTAENGADGLEISENVQPDVIVIDVGMPYIDGYQVVRALRGDPQTAQTPIVMLSARTDVRDKLIGLMSGADFYLTKPVGAYALVQAIQTAQNLSKKNREYQITVLSDSDVSEDAAQIDPAAVSSICDISEPLQNSVEPVSADLANKEDVADEH